MESTKKEKELRFHWKRLLNYQSVVKQIPFFLFLALLAVVYIYNGHYADKTIREISKTERELKELKYEYKTVKGDVLFRSKQSELVKAVEPLGLKELMAAPVVLVDSSNIVESIPKLYSHCAVKLCCFRSCFLHPACARPLLEKYVR
jgi:hypothetical protein